MPLQTPLRKLVSRSAFALITIDIEGLADCDYTTDKYRDMDPENPEEIKEFIKNEMPILNRVPAPTREIVQYSILYYCLISKSTIDWDRLFYGCLPPIEAPKNIKDFFLCYYDAFFGNHNEVDLSQFEFVEDDTINVFAGVRL